MSVLPGAFVAAVPLAAVLLDRLWGEPPTRIHPVCLMGRLAVGMESWWRKTVGDGFGAGMGATLSTVLPFVMGAGGLVFAAGKAGLGLQWPLAVGCVYVCLAPRSLGEHGMRVREPLQRGDVEGARMAVGLLVGRDTAVLDGHGIARACVESVSENLTDGVLSTLFWAGVGLLCGGLIFKGVSASLVLGVVGAVLHRVCNVLDALWGKRNTRYAHFGACAARMDDVLNFFPARLSLLIIALACLFVAGEWAGPKAAWQALRVGWQWRKAHASPNSPWSEAAFAGAMRLKLGGPVWYKGLHAPYPYMGDGSLDATPQHIAQAVALMWTSTWLFALLTSLILATSGLCGSFASAGIG